MEAHGAGKFEVHFSHPEQAKLADPVWQGVLMRRSVHRVSASFFKCPLVFGGSFNHYEAGCPRCSLMARSLLYATVQS